MSHLERLNGELQVIDRAGRGCEMENQIHRARQIDELRHIMLDKVKIRIAAQVSDISQVPRQEVVQSHHLVAFGKETIRKVGAQKACGSGDDGGFLNAHRKVWLRRNWARVRGQIPPVASDMWAKHMVPALWGLLCLQFGRTNPVHEAPPDTPPPPQ